MPRNGNRGKINNFSNKPSDVENVIQQAFAYPNQGHGDYINAFVDEMNK
jgi:D-alanyl-D-alanine carboxypeptidase